MRGWIALGVWLMACGPGADASGSRPASAPPLRAHDAPLPGPCVDPVPDAGARLGSDADLAGMRVDRSFDLDADGVPDPFVTHPIFCGTGGCDWNLYVQRGACAHHVGRVFAVLPLPQTLRHRGLVDLLGAARNGCAGLARTESLLVFDGDHYRIARERRCGCPSPDRPGAPDPDALCEQWRPPKR